MDLHTMIERANAQLAKRTAGLNDTLDQLAIVQDLERNTPGAYEQSLKQLHTKARRQKAAVEATAGLIRSFNAALKKPTK